MHLLAFGTHSRLYLLVIVKVVWLTKHNQRLHHHALMPIQTKCLKKGVLSAGDAAVRLQLLITGTKKSAKNLNEPSTFTPSKCMAMQFRQFTTTYMSTLSKIYGVRTFIHLFYLFLFFNLCNRLTVCRQRYTWWILYARVQKLASVRWPCHMCIYRPSLCVQPLEGRLTLWIDPLTSAILPWIQGDDIPESSQQNGHILMWLGKLFKR